MTAISDSISAVKDSIGWEAAATLISGGFAVLAALILGIRQTNILSAQVSLESFKYREALFDRRYRVFEAVQDYVYQLLSYGAVSQEDTNRYSLELGRARFLFNAETRAKIIELDGLLNNVRAAEASLLSVDIKDEHRPLHQGHLELLRAEVKAASVLLPSIFGDELQLGSVRSEMPRWQMGYTGKRIN